MPCFKLLFALETRSDSPLTQIKEIYTQKGDEVKIQYGSWDNAGLLEHYGFVLGIYVSLYVCPYMCPYMCVLIYVS